MRKLMIGLLLVLNSFLNISQSHTTIPISNQIPNTTIETIDKALETTSNTKKYLLNNFNIRTTNLPIDLPFNPKDFLYFSSFYGMRMHPIYKVKKLHRGIDIVLPLNSEVYASADGVVKQVSYSYGYGKKVVIDHENGIETIYGHLNGTNVKVGEIVKSGQLIAHSGNTGVSTGPHLHYEIRIHKKSIDPLKLLSCTKGNLLQTMLNFKNFKKWEQNQISFRVQ